MTLGEEAGTTTETTIIAIVIPGLTKGRGAFGTRTRTTPPHGLGGHRGTTFMQRQHVRVGSFSCPFNGGGRFVLGPRLSHRMPLPSAPLQPAEHALEHPPQLTVSLT
jgi:hypothetical protein